jgi:hypothetical protein
MTNIAGSGSTSQRHGSEDPDPDPPQNVMDPQHWLKLMDTKKGKTTKKNIFPLLRDPEWKKPGTGIQDKHPESATLVSMKSMEL